MALPSVSVALATHNGERHLQAQLDSLLGQRHAPLELVVNDDGSTDGTVALVETFAARAPFPVRLDVNPRRLGFGDNFLRAASRCTGDLVAFSDQDDVWLAGKLERCAQAFADEDVVLAVHANRVVDDALGPTGASFPALEDAVVPPRSTDPWLPLPGMAMVAARRLLEFPSGDRPPSHDLDGPIRHDEWVYLLARVTGSIAFIAEPLGLYRQHAGNLTGAPRRGPVAFVRELRATGGAYYAARRDQAAGSARVLAALGLEAGAAEYAALAQTLARRAALYDPALGRRTRLGGLGRLAADGAYRGAPGRFLKDLAAACSGR